MSEGKMVMGNGTDLVMLARIRWKGTTDFDGLLRMMHGWFTGQEYDLLETRFKHRTKPQGSEMEINWKAWRDANPFLRNWIYVYFHIWDYKDVEVIKDGKKRTLGKFRMLIDFRIDIEADYEGRWLNSAFKRWLLTSYLKHIYKQQLDNIWTDKLWYKGHQLHQETKQYLGMSAHSDVYDDMW